MLLLYATPKMRLTTQLLKPYSTTTSLGNLQAEGITQRLNRIKEKKEKQIIGVYEHMTLASLAMESQKHQQLDSNPIGVKEEAPTDFNTL